jgi:hypothetical protein
MLWQTKAVQSEELRAMPHALVAALLVAVLAIFMTLTAGTAHACPPGKDASGSFSTEHKARHPAVTRSVTSTPVLAKDISQGSRRCCGGCSHSHGIGCASGCCSACSAAIDAASSGLALLDGSIGHILPRPDGVTPTRPSPDFRPPRSVA